MIKWSTVEKTENGRVKRKERSMYKRMGINE